MTRAISKRKAIWALAGLTAVLVAASCGQRAGVHHATLGGPVQGGRLAAGALQPSPNGENRGPSVRSPTYRIVTVTRTRVATGDGPLYICPVQGHGSYSDDFGAPRYAGGFHLHQGNDIFAAMSTPIVAPFDGYATNSSNGLGGQAVTVHGRGGYVYNAHLSKFGRLGWVKTGTIIGYVGNSGDAQGGSPHDHFEWHPGNGHAVDPYPFLREVC
jgi:murein DD-endopeptidase MepM/ murein hydrolase activator NlpD